MLLCLARILKKEVFLNTFYDWIILGDGICSDLFLWHLSSSELSKGKKILKISSSKLFPPCSHFSTSYASLSGIKKGVSELGDLIYESYHELEKFLEDEGPLGVFEGKHFLLPEENKRENFIKRFVGLDEFFYRDQKFEGKQLKAHLFDYEIFSKWIKNEIHQRCSLEFLDDTVLEFLPKLKSVKTHSGNYFLYKNIIFCTGAYTSFLFKKGLTSVEDHLFSSKIVPGNYITFKNVNIGKDSFVFSQGHSNMIYRSFTRTLLFGGTTNKNQVFALNKAELQNQYEQLGKILGDNLPPFDSGTIQTGNRHKGKKRRPFWGKVDENVWGIWGVYKNGFTFPFLAGKQLVKLLEKE